MIRKESSSQEKAIQLVTDAIHDAQIDLSKKEQQLKDKQVLEERRDGLNNEIVADESDLKVGFRFIRCPSFNKVNTNPSFSMALGRGRED